jgi:hypothetical protein
LRGLAQAEDCIFADLSLARSKRWRRTLPSTAPTPALSEPIRNLV